MLVCCASEDLWSNPTGQKEMASKCTNAEFFMRDGKHSVTKEDWKAMIEFVVKRKGVI